jgi:hypothetical protein
MLVRMTRVIIALMLAWLPVEAQQPGEKPVDPLSARVSVTGCLRGRNLTAIDPAERAGEPVNVRIQPGRPFRLSGSKALMKDLSKHDKKMVEVTGLVRKSALDPSLQGMPIGRGGRVRIGGTPPVSQDPTRMPGRDPISNMEVLDVESFRPVEGVCSKK